MLEARDRWGWGPRKLHAVLKAARAGRPRRRGPSPRSSAATAASPPRPRPRRAPPPQRFERGAPNELWQLDFKGPLEVERRRVCPLSVLDDHSRYLLALRPCTDQTYATVQAVLWDLFGDVGLPEAMLCDNAFSRPQQRPWGCRPSTPG